MKRLLLVLVVSFLSYSSWAQIKGNGAIDLDGNKYKTVKIGTQEWFAENLKVTKYQNGDAIQLITDTVAWTSLTTGAYCNYKNDEKIAQEYGRLYNFFVVADNRKLCPFGWHVPSDKDWDILCEYLGGNLVAGGKMKEGGTDHWWGPNVGSIDPVTQEYGYKLNESGFSALPAGRQYHNCYTFLGQYTNIWSTTQCEYDDDLVWCRYMTFSLPHLSRFTYKKHYGLSVRCVKD